MNKSELIAAMASDAGITKAAATQALNSLVRHVGTSIAKGDDVFIAGFGTFAVADRKARKGYNPRTREDIQIAARRAIAFRPAAATKAAINI